MKKIKQILSISLLSCMMFTSCTKTATDDASKFAGTWTGTSCGSASTFTLTKVNNTTLTTSGTVGNGTCTKAVTITHTASGNNLTVPSQTFTDNCANSYTFSGSGSLSGNTLTITETVSGSINLTCTFTGTK